MTRWSAAGPLVRCWSVHYASKSGPAITPYKECIKMKTSQLVRSWSAQSYKKIVIISMALTGPLAKAKARAGGQRTLAGRWLAGFFFLSCFSSHGAVV